MEVCWRGEISEVRDLIKAGADINARNGNGTTPLMYAKTHAFSTGKTDIMKLLLEHGADPQLQDNAGKTAADYTLERSQIILQILAKR